MNIASTRDGARTQPALLGPALLSVFVLSGFAGLIYQSIWTHYLGLILGHAAYAQALVLAIFMGGMAFGAALISRFGGRWVNLIRGYAAIEFAIGLAGLVFHQVFLATQGFAYDYLIPALGTPASINVAKWLLSATLILPQSILLGMTFPLMSSGLMRRIKDNDGRILGGLYFTNSIGAAIGALFSTFILLPTIGLPGAVATAAWLNVAVAFIAWLLSKGNEVPRLESPRDRSDTVLPVHTERARLLRLVLIATTASAAASFVYEIVWVRMLALAVGSTLHAFELMLASFIAGLAFGGLWIRGRIDKQKFPLVMVGWMQVFMGLAALASLVLYAESFEWVSYMMRSLARSNEGYDLFNIGTASIAVLIMLPAAFFAGTTLPLYTVTLLRAGTGESAIGRVYAWNTFGSIIGVFAAVHLLIPLVGLKLTLTVAATVDILIGLALLRWQVGSNRAMSQFALAGGVSVFALAGVTLGIHFDPLKLASGVYRTGKASLHSKVETPYYRDGKTASVSISMAPDNLRVIATNGKPDAGMFVTNPSDPAPPIASDEPTMALAAALPMALHPQAEKVAIIGFGSGLTTHTMLGFEQLKRVDTVEIEPAMVEGARWFDHRNRRAYTDPRSNIVIDDAKSYFSGHQEKYDIIVSEPSNPWVSGVGALFTKEFYSYVPRHLNQDGLFLQWLQLYEINDELVASVLKALDTHFNDYAAWLTNTSDLLIVATQANKLPEFNGSVLQHGIPTEDLKRIGITQPEQLQFRKVADKRLLRAAAELFVISANSDFHPLLSLYAPRSRYLSQDANGVRLLATSSLPLLDILGIRAPLAASVPPSREGRFIADQFVDIGRRQVSILQGQPATGPGFAYQTDGNEHIGRALSLRTLGSGCNLPRSKLETNLFLDDLANLASTTIPYLSHEELRAVFLEPAWMPCENIPEIVADAMALFGALAQRDLSAIAVSAQVWLDKHKGNTSNVDNFALLTLMATHLAQGHPDRAAGVEKSLGENIVTVGHRLYVRQLLLVYGRLLKEEHTSRNTAN